MKEHKLCKENKPFLFRKASELHQNFKTVPAKKSTVSLAHKNYVPNSKRKGCGGRKIILTQK